jgi:hypothetical protein
MREPTKQEKRKGPRWGFKGDEGENERYHISLWSG